MSHVIGIQSHLNFARHLGIRLESNARVLDFGCGIGKSVASLLDLGFDAYGVDIKEFWGRDLDLYWDTKEPPLVHVAERLHVAQNEPYRVPFPDGHFDFCFSDQVMEHITDHSAVFAEILRVLKPGALSLHRFPGPGRLMEDHIKLPSPALCRRPVYVALCCFAGWRPPGQGHLGWREAAAYTSRWMATCAYPTKRQLRIIADRCGAAIRFVEAEEMRFRHGARGFALSQLGPLLQRYMVLRTRP